VELFRKADVGVLLDDCAAGLAVALAVLLIRAALRRAGS
jgi:phosphatidylglycerophosphatase A